METHKAEVPPYQLCDRLRHPDLVVHEHDGGQHGVFTDGSLERIDAYKAIGLDWQVGHVEPFQLQDPAGVQHALVLGLQDSKERRCLSR